jgi:hypothetical protein
MRRGLSLDRTSLSLVEPFGHLVDDTVDAEFCTHFVQPTLAIGTIARGIEVKFHFDGPVAIFRDAESFEKALGKVAQSAIGRRRGILGWSMIGFHT